MFHKKLNAKIKNNREENLDNLVQVVLLMKTQQDIINGLEKTVKNIIDADEQHNETILGMDVLLNKIRMSVEEQNELIKGIDERLGNLEEWVYDISALLVGEDDIDEDCEYMCDDCIEKSKKEKKKQKSKKK